MQRRVVTRTDPRYNQIRSRNNDSVKKSREKSRRERDDTMGAIHQLEEENEQLIERIQLLKREYEQLEELFKQHTGISLDQLESSNTTSIPPKAIEQPNEVPSKPVLTINTNDVKTAAISDIELDASTLDGAIVVINGVQYKIMKFSVHILFLLCFTFVLLVTSQETLSNDNTKRKKQDFYCSACKSMSETIFHEMNNPDPNERIQVGSYRVDGHGHQKLKDVPIFETRYHAENVLENLCSKFIKNGREIIPTQLRNIYEHACDDILEEHHDSLTDLLLTQMKDIQTSRQLADIICVETNQYCQADQLEELFKPPPPPPNEEKEEEEEEEEEAKEEDKNEL